jgi:hypothetical protein
MDVIGYSERGAVNSLFYEIAYSSDASFLLSELMLRTTFPYTQRRPPVGDAKVLIEQSFSDFGAADAVILYADRPCSVFVEAKVKTWSVGDWSIDRKFSDFASELQSKGSSSNLFRQLYYKFRLVEALRRGETTLEEGVSFPGWSSKQLRKIGGNRVVRQAVKCLRRSMSEVFYLALVPDRADRVASFFHSLLIRGPVDGVDDWDMSMCGYLTWDQVEEFCAENSLKHTLAVLAFNKGQVY